MKKIPLIILSAAFGFNCFSASLVPVKGADDIRLHSTFEDGEEGLYGSSRLSAAGKTASGDINKDGYINIADYCLMKSAALGLQQDP